MKNLKKKIMKMNKKTLKIRWGLSSKTMIQELCNVLFSVYLDLNTNKVINQKYFYSNNDSDNINYVIIDFINNYNNNSSVKINKFKTVKEIKISKEEKEKLKKYLKEKKISIRYFEKFEGYINLITFESYKEYVDYLIKNICICFTNSLLKEKKIIINIKKEEDIDMLLFILKNYFEDFIVIELVQDQINLYNNVLKILKKDFFFSDVGLVKSLKKWINYLEKYKNLVNYIKNLELIESKKNYIYMEIKQNLNKKKLYKFFLNNPDMYKLYKLYEKQFLNFKGYIFLVEIEIIIDNQKIKRFVIFFYNINNKDLFFFKLLDIFRVSFILSILKEILIEKDNKIDEFLLNELISKINNVNISLKNDYIFEEFDNVSFNKDNINIMVVNDYKSLLFYLKHYELFFS
jgi:hypothetical protein